MSANVLTVFSLWQREMIRFYRQRTRILGALGTPFVFWLFIGAGFGSSFRAGIYSEETGLNYLSYFYPGSILLVLLFTSIFSTFSLIQDRQEGFLQGVLVAPVSRSSIVLGKIFGSATLAVIQGCLFLCFIPFVGLSLDGGQWLLTVSAIILNSFVLAAFGFCLAWVFNSIQGFHAIVNLCWMPLWFLSGAFFPPEGSPAWIQFVIKLNPLTYGLALIRRGLYGGDAGLQFLPTSQHSFLVLGIVGLIVFVLATWLSSRRATE